MELQSVVNEKSLKEMKKNLIKPQVRVTCSVASIALFVLGVFFFFVGNFSTTFYCLMGIIFFNVELKIMESNQVKGFLKRMKQVCGTDEVQTPVVLADEEILLKNVLSGEEMNVPYKKMEHFFETNNYYALMTKEWQATIIDKASLSEEELAEFLRIVDEKMPNLKKHDNKKRERKKREKKEK